MSELKNVTALDAFQERRNGQSAKGGVPVSGLIKRASDTPSRTIKWAWRGRLALGYLTVQTGEEGLGKSVFGAWLTARATRGDLEGVWKDKPVNVLVVAGEDAIEDTWVPRLELAGADLDRVMFLNLDGLDPAWNVHGGIEDLRQTIKSTDAKLVVFDALLDQMPAATGGENINSPTFVRTALRPLKYLVRELGITGLVSLHPPKARGATFRDLVQASQAFSAIPRIGLYFGYHPDDAEDDPQRRRVLVRGKGNIGRNPGALEFRIEGRDHCHGDGEIQEREVVVDVLPSDVTLTRLLARPGMARDERVSKVEQAAEIMRAQLGDGEEHLSGPILKLLAERGLNHAQTVADAKKLAGVKSRKQDGVSNGSWLWSIPHPPGEESTSPISLSLDSSTQIGPNPLWSSEESKNQDSGDGLSLRGS